MRLHRASMFFLSLLLLCAPCVFAEDTVPAPIFDIPQLDRIQVDGKPDDWGTRGFQVEAFAAGETEAISRADFDASLRLGWNARGVLALLKVRDSSPQEEANEDALWQKDSVQFFMGTEPDRADRIQVILAPGIDPAHPTLRYRIIDQRKSTFLKAIAPTATLACTRMPDGYVLEALLPWQNLGLFAKLEDTFAFQAVVSNYDGQRLHTLLWYPITGTYADASKMYPLRLSEQASRAVRAAGSGSYERFRRTRVRVSAPEAFAGKRVEIREGRRILAIGDLRREADRATADFLLPMPPLGKTYAPLSIAIARRVEGWLVLPDADALRRQAYREAAFLFRPFVFSGNRFPSGDFEQPSLVEDLIGNYTVTTTFYDASYNPVATAEAPGRYGAIVNIEGENGFKDRRFFTLFRTREAIAWRAKHMSFAVELPAELGISPTVTRAQQAPLSDYLKWQTVDGFSRDPYSAVLLAGLAETDSGSSSARVDSRDGKWWYSLRKKTGDQHPLQYLLSLPQGYAADLTKRWPLILFLHGSGERGDDLERVKTHGPPKVAQTRDLPFIILSPQCPEGQWWSPWALRDLLDDICARYRVDPDRIYLTGLSMGGYGAWDMAVEFPDRFAAIAPICGGGDPGAVAAIKHLPVWVFHGGKDPTVPLRSSEEMVQALRALGNPVQFTVYPEAGHDSWTETYNNPKLYEWFLQHRRGENGK